MNRYSSQSLERGESASSYGLTPLQEGMLYDHLTASNPALDVEQVVGEFQATLDIQVYEEAWSTIAVHHDVLRSRFYVLDDGRARQEVVPAVQHPFSSEDLSGKSDQQVQQQIQKYLDEDRRRGFSLDQAPASRAHVFILGENRYVLVWTFHHIILDGRSHARVLRDVYEVYEHLKSGVTSETPEIEVRGSFRDYVERAAACSEDQATNDHAETYWRKRLASIESPTRLPQLGLGGELQDQAAGHDDVSIEISDARFNRLQEVIRTHSLTINSVLQAAWSLLLARYTGEACVVFGSIRANPPLVKPAAKAPIGIYINNLPTVADVGASQSLVDLAKSIQLSQFTEMRRFAHVPLSKIQSWSPLTSKSALFDSLFVYDHRDLNGALRALDAKVDCCDLKLLEQTRYAVTLLAFGEPQLRVVLRFDRRQLDAQIAQQILGHLQQVLDQFCHAAETPISDLKILAEGEREKLIHGFNETEAEYPENETLDSMFRAQCERTPDSPAVISEQETWSYRQLSDHATAVASALVEAGVERETVVGVMIDRSCEMMAALLGVIRAGCAYLPLNPEDPPARLSYMLETASAGVVLVQREHTGKLDKAAIRHMPIDEAMQMTPLSDTDFARPSAEDLAYVIFTSGSTGRPKGVMIEHRSICNRLRWMQDQFRLTADDRVFQKTPLTFDVSVWEVFWPIVEGASIVMAAPGRHRDSRYIASTIDSQRITFMHFVPSMLRHFLSEDGLETLCRSLRCVVCSGEELTPADVSRFKSRLAASLHNLYGPTEAAVDVSHWDCDAPSCCETVPIGRSIANTRLYVLDPTGQPCPVGVPGELCIAGVQVARGYVGRPDLTAERFLTDELTGLGDRMYRTGDRARWLPDGSIEFLGRNDLEIKLHGVRIDLREIESALRESTSIDDAVVVVREAPGGQRRLVAYYTVTDKTAESELRGRLREILPSAMVPSVFVQLDEIPLGTAGKVSRSLLPEPPEPTESVSPAASDTGSDLERKIAEIWSQALGHSRVGLSDNFFDLGGQSMMLLSVHRKIEQTLRVEFPITKSLEHTTVQSLASYLQNTAATNPRVARGRARGARRRTRSR